MKRTIAWAAAICCMLTMASSAQEKYKYNEFYFQRSTLFQELPVSKKDIVFFGNSLTNGCEWHELFNMSNVKNRGISSDVIQGLYDRVEPIIAGKPKKIFVLSGVNDISHNLTADSVARAMEELIIRIKEGSPRTKIYLQSLLPINNDFRRYKAMIGKEQVILDTNALLKEVAQRNGVTWVDLFLVFADKDGKMPVKYTNDGLHLLGPGYLLWRDTILKYVK